jgi:hypothetical protein
MRETTRKTHRKALIEKVIAEQFANKPVLLEELRWQVLLQEYDAKGVPFDEMTVSNMKSFARTIREHMPSVGIHKLRRPDLLPVGILARAAVFRIRRQALLREVLNSKGLCVYCSIHQEKVTNRRALVGCFLCVDGQDRKYSSASAFFPTTVPLTIVGPLPSVSDLFVLASLAVNWNMFRVHDKYGSMKSVSHEQPTRIPSRPEKWMVGERKMYKMFWKEPEKYVQSQFYRKRLSDLILSTPEKQLYKE